MAVVSGNDSKVGSTSPYTAAHAVVFVDFGLLFRKGIEAEEHDGLIAAMAAHLDAMGFVQDQENACDSDDTLAAFQRFGADEKPLEELHVHGGQIHLLVHEYRGWEVSRDMAMERLFPAFEFLRKSEHDHTRLALGFRDAFINEDVDSYSPFDVFQHSDLLPNATLSGSPYWEYNYTSADDVDGELCSAVYSRLRVEARVMQVEESDDGSEEHVHWTEIVHRQQAAGNCQVPLDVEWSDESIRHRLDLMHTRNKSVMQSLLSVEMASRIGLVEDSK